MLVFFFFFNDTATTEIYTLSLHDALPISLGANCQLPLWSLMGAPFSKKRFCPARAPLILYEEFTSQPRVPEKPLGPKASCVKMTPGVRDISMYVWRPLSGNSWVLMGSKTKPPSAEH